MVPADSQLLLKCCFSFLRTAFNPTKPAIAVEHGDTGVATCGDNAPVCGHEHFKGELVNKLKAGFPTGAACRRLSLWEDLSGLSWWVLESKMSLCTELFLNEKQNVGTIVHFRGFLSRVTSQNTSPRCCNEDFSPQAVIFEAFFFSVLVTCVCVINNLDGPLSQIYYSVHFKRSQVLLVQSNVSQKGSWNRQKKKERETAHVSRLWGNSTIQCISLSRPVASSVSCCSDWVGCMEAQSKRSWMETSACCIHIKRHTSCLSWLCSVYPFTSQWSRNRVVFG